MHSYAEQLKKLNAAIGYSEKTIITLRAVLADTLAYQNQVFQAPIDGRIVDERIKLKSSIENYETTILTLQKLHIAILSYRENVLLRLDASYRTAMTDARASIARITGNAEGGMHNE